MAINRKVLAEIEAVITAQTGWLFPDAVAAIVGCQQDSARDHLSHLAKKERIIRQWVKLGKQSKFIYSRLGSLPPRDLSFAQPKAVREPKVVVFQPSEPGVWKYLRAVTAQMEDGEPVGEVELLLVETMLGNASSCDKSREQSALLARCRKLADECRQALARTREAAEMAPASRSLGGRSLPGSTAARPSTCRRLASRPASSADRGLPLASAR